LSPSPPGLTGLVGDLLNDPPRFDRSVMIEVDKKITAFFVQHLSSQQRSAHHPGRYLASSRSMPFGSCIKAPLIQPGMSPT
jgi:hypothetical protein